MKDDFKVTIVNPHIDTSLIPDYIRRELFAAAYEATKEYFKQPGAMEKFERWKAEKDKKAAEAAQAQKANKDPSGSK